MFSAECWTVTTQVETRLSVMETKMLHWTAGVMRLDRIRNHAIIRQRFGAVLNAAKLRETRLHECYPIIGTNADNVRKNGLNIYVHGT